MKTYISTALARVRGVFLVHWGLGVNHRGFHLVATCSGLQRITNCMYVCLSPQANTQTQGDCERSRMEERMDEQRMRLMR